MSTPTKGLFFYIVMALILAGCATARAAGPDATPTPAAIQVSNPYAPQAGDSALSPDTVTFVGAEAAKNGSQVQLDIAYRLPTPCHQTRVVVNPPESSGRINIKLYSLFEPNKPCTLMALATPLHATLDLGGLVAGSYTVYVNDEKAVEFSK